jgi:hypothetical protein
MVTAVSADRGISTPPPSSTPPARAPVDTTSRASGREVVERNTRGNDVDVKAVARDLRDEIKQRPQDATKLTKEALEHVKADDRDELAQEFIRAHSDSELKSLAQTDAGKGALALSVNELAKGKVHKDEAKDAERVGNALGTKIELEVNTGWARVSNAIHTVLDLAGFIPGLGAIPDLINAGIYAAEGDFKNAALSATAAVPVAGDAIKGGAMAIKGVKHLDEAVGVARAVGKRGDEAVDVAKTVGKQSDEVVDAAKTAGKQGDEAATAGSSKSAGSASESSKALSGETASTAKGKDVHRRLADERRASEQFDLVNRPIPDASGKPIEVPKRVDLKTGEPIAAKGTQQAIPDAVKFDRGGIVIDDKPIGRPIAKDRQEIIRFIRAYEKATGELPKTIAIQRYDAITGMPVKTDLFKPSDFLPGGKP